MDKMTAELVEAAMVAPDDRKEPALRLLRGEQHANGKGVEPYDTLRGIGKTLNFHPATLWRWKIPGHDLGGRRRFILSEVCVYLKSAEFLTRVADLKAARRAKFQTQGVV